LTTAAENFIVGVGGIPFEEAAMNVNLTPELENLVRGKVRTGRYNSASEVVREALRLLEERDRDLAPRRQELRKKIREGMDSLRRGEGVDGEAVFDRLGAEIDRVERVKAG
jgi:antitoxin ParD1/3/4